MQKFQAQNQFESPSPAVIGIEELRPPRSFRLSDQNDALLDAAKLELLEAMGCARRPLPPNLAVQPGRSVASALTSEAAQEWRIPALKMKGGAGLEPLERGLVMRFPRPQERFGVFDQPHLGIDEGLALTVSRSLPKGRYCLEHSRARNEFACHEELARQGLGFRPLAAGQLFGPNGAPERNLNGEAIGVVFLENDPRYRYLFQFVEFYVVDHLSGGAATPLVLGRGRTARQGSLKDCLHRYQTFSRRLAQAKWRLFAAAKIARHVGHFGNCLYSEDNDRLILTDMDTSLLLRNLNEEKWGPQLLRDLASDLSRNVSMLSFLAFSAPYLERLSTGALNPFTGFLTGFFGRNLPRPTLENACEKLLFRYNRFLRANNESLKGMARCRTYAVLNRRMDLVKGLHGGWNYQHLPFLTDILQSCYDLIRQSRLPDMGFRLAPVPQKSRATSFRDGVAKLMAAYAEERALQEQRLENKAGALNEGADRNVPNFSGGTMPGQLSRNP